MAAAPGTMRAESVKFVERVAAGVFSASFEVPVGAILTDVIVHATALWAAATSATLIVGDATDDDGIFTAVNLKATDILAGESLSFESNGGKQGADVDATGVAATHIRRRGLAAARTLSCKVTTVGGAAAPTGITDVVFVYAYPNAITPSFA